MKRGAVALLIGLAVLAVVAVRVARTFRLVYPRHVSETVSIVDYPSNSPAGHAAPK